MVTLESDRLDVYNDSSSYISEGKNDLEEKRVDITGDMELEMESKIGYRIPVQTASTSESFVITNQPGSSGNSNYGSDWEEMSSGTMTSGSKSFHLKYKRPTGLASLAVSDSLLIEVRPGTYNCDWDTNYEIKDVGLPEETLIFTALEELQCCSFGSLQNIVIRDPENSPVARVCYKEKSCLSGKLVMAVYAPPDLLVGSGEESSHFGLCYSPRFHLRNSEGENLFIVQYTRSLCPRTNKFLIQTTDGHTDMARILSKTQSAIRLEFSSKISVTLKMILMGFCIGVLHKTYKQAHMDMDT